MEASPPNHHHHHSSSSPSHPPASATSKLTLPATTNPPSPSNPPKPKVWLIFGATGHMGRSLIKTCLQHNDLVSAIGQSHIDTLSSVQNLSPPNSPSPSSSFLGLLCDVRIRSTVSSAITATISYFGRLDVVANCSGYGVIGSCEDQDEYEIRNQFETNFMGTLNIIQLSLPYFRTRGEGRYLIFSSTSGALGVPGLGPYCASKYAVEGLIESMLYEVDGFGIRATLVEPAHLRRDDIHHCPSPPTTIKAKSKTNGAPPQPTSQPEMPLYAHFKILKPSLPYSTPDSPSKHAQRLLQWIGDHQPTSVVKAAELSWQLGHCSFPPLRLLLGSYAVESVRDRLRSVIEEIEDWKGLHFPAEQEEGGEDGEGEEDEEDEDDEGDEEEVEDEGKEEDEDREMERAKGKRRIKREGKERDVNMEDA